MFVKAFRDDPLIDLGGSAMVGDSSSDIQAGAGFGMVTVLLGDERHPTEEGFVRPDHFAPTLADAVDWLLSHRPA